MTAPQPAEFRIDDLIVSPNSPVLHRRTILRDSPAFAVSRFGDPVWDLRPALRDGHNASQPMHSTLYPESLRLTCKLYVFALINVEDPPRFSNARSGWPDVKTIWGEQHGLRVFLHWLAEQGIGTIADATTADLDRYYRHVTDLPGSSGRRRRLLLAVQRLHLYRDFLPEFCRFPFIRLWGGATAYELAGDHDPQQLGNRTPRIHPDAMQKLLSAALLVVETIGADIRPAAKRLVAIRALALRVATTTRRQRTRGSSHFKQHLELLLPAFAEAGHPLPGIGKNGRVEVDINGLALAGQLDRGMLQRKYAATTITASGLPIRADLLRVTRIGRIGDRPWRDRPIETTELPFLIRMITTACYLAIAYLSGIRTGEALNLRRGCVTRDTKLGMIFLSGQQMKAGPGRTERAPHTIPWVINEQGALAISTLEDLAASSVLFPADFFGSPGWMDATRSRTIGSINTDIRDFIDWFNTTVAAATDHAIIGGDDHGRITGMRLRRTLAWHIVRRPGGTIAGATQYGHLFTQITHGYAGQADAGFLDEITFEQFLLRVEQIYDDHQRLGAGEHVSGPAADLYRNRVTTGAQFNGLTITSRAQVDTALANPNLQIHHGALLTCVWRPETAACRNDSSHPDDAPTWPRCRLTCTNIAYTDRDITELRKHVTQLKADLDMPGLPEPLHQRISERITGHENAIRAHNTLTDTAARTPTDDSH